MVICLIFDICYLEFNLLPYQRLMYPPLIAVGMLDANPVTLSFENFKRYSFINRKQYFIAGAGSGTNIALIDLGNNCWYFLD